MPITFTPDTAGTTRKISTISFSDKAKPQPKRTTSACPLDAPFSIVIDTAEQLDYTFSNLHADAAQLHRPLVVRTVRRRLALPRPHHRRSFDYSIEGYETVVGIERKSHEDFCNTLAGRTRARFEQKLAVINATFRHFVVIVEAGWSDILDNPPDFSAAIPKTLFRTVISWMARYPRVHWLMMPGRIRAEQAAYRVMERWWKELSADKTKVPGVPPGPSLFASRPKPTSAPSSG